MNRKSLIYGIAINDADYVVKWREVVVGIDGTTRTKHVSCKIYETWKDMIRRCFSVKYKNRYPTYKDVTCCDSWLKFSAFKKWMEIQNWEGKQLDKDILFEGNKVYSPERCVFVDNTVNKLVLENTHRNSPWLTGVIQRNSGRYVAYGRKYEEGKNKTLYLGTFDSEIEAHKCWLNYKINQVRCLKSVLDSRVYSALLNRYQKRLAIIE